MKKIFGLLALILLMGCDDGDMTFNTFDFSNAQPQSCGGDSRIIYKVNGTEVLLLDFDPANFANVVTDVAGRTVTIGGSNRIIYRNYSGPVTTGPSGTLCNVVPAATPTVQEEWIGVSGSTVRIITTEVRNDDGKLTGFNHQITLVNVRFKKGEEEITITDNPFGTYTTPLGYNFDFAGKTEEGTDAILFEDCNNIVYKKNASEALILSLAPGTFGTSVGSVSINLSDTADANNVLFRIYSGSVTNGVLCDGVPPVTPVVKEGWSATDGTLKIETILDGTVYRYKIYFSNVAFTNSDNSGETFRSGAGTDLLIGTYTPSP